MKKCPLERPIGQDRQECRANCGLYDEVDECCGVLAILGVLRDIAYPGIEGKKANWPEVRRHECS